MKHHLDNSHKEDGSKRDGTRHGREFDCPEVAETWVAKREEGGWQEMNKGCGYQDTGTEVSDQEEESLRNS